MKSDLRVKDIKNMQSDYWIFKICSRINFFSGSLQLWVDNKLYKHWIKE